MAREGAGDHAAPEELILSSNSNNNNNEKAESYWGLAIDKFRLPPCHSNNSVAPDHRGIDSPQAQHRDQASPLLSLLPGPPPTPGEQRKVSEHYKNQERLLEGNNEMEAMTESGCLPVNPTELVQRERMAVNISNAANLVLFIAKVYASIESGSLAVTASTLDSFLYHLWGLILWFTSHAMRKPNQYRYPIGKNRMHPVGIVVFASIIVTQGSKILNKSILQLIGKEETHMNEGKEKWMIGIMLSVTVVKFVLVRYCRRFKNAIIRAYAQDHLFDVITNSVGLATVVLAVAYQWWIDPTGAIIIALYTINKWARTMRENENSLIHGASRIHSEGDISDMESP